MEYKIRKIQERDRAVLSEICIATAVYNRIKNPRGNYARALALIYADYYAVCERDSCFVVVDENDTPKGYILCAPNFDDYVKKFKSQFSKQLAKLGVWYSISHKLSVRADKKFATEFPSHLHIDLLFEVQNQGLGGALLETLFEYLKAQNVRGVMLGCYAKNFGAIKFYSRHGFVELERTKKHVTMGKKL